MLKFFQLRLIQHQDTPSVARCVLISGTDNHIDQCKTAPVKDLTCVDGDRLKKKTPTGLDVGELCARLV